MQSQIIPPDGENIKVEKYILSIYPNLSYGTLQKAFRKRDIKVNGTRVGRDHILKANDLLEIYITDDLLLGAAKIGNALRPGFTIVYEDKNVLLVNKEQGVPVHPDKDQAQNTLIDQVRDYLMQSNPETRFNDQFQPKLCHRLDRNTGGIVIISKNSASHDVLLKKLETGEIRKFYKCLVKGCPGKKESVLKAYLRKDAGKSRVFISDQKAPGSVNIITKYRVIEYDESRDVSLLEVELITGRTHQIRAHMAYIGHPIIGDGKYGLNSVNRKFGLKMQALWAYKLKFDFKGKSILDYLNQREFTVEPGFDISKL